MSERIIMDEAAIQRTVTRMAHEILNITKVQKILCYSELKREANFSNTYTRQNQSN